MFDRRSIYYLTCPAEYARKALAELLGHEAVDDRIHRAVHVEKDACGDVDQPIVSVVEVLEEGWHDTSAHHAHHVPDLKRKETHVEQEDDANEHHNELAPLSYQLLQVLLVDADASATVGCRQKTRLLTLLPTTRRSRHILACILLLLRLLFLLLSLPPDFGIRLCDEVGFVDIRAVHGDCRGAHRCPSSSSSARSASVEQR